MFSLEMLLRINDEGAHILTKKERREFAVRHLENRLGVSNNSTDPMLGAMAAVADMVFGKEVRVDTRKKDRYGRTIGRVWVASADCQASDCPKTLDAGMALLTMGLAWHYKQYAKEQPEEERGQYSFAEEEARAKRVGLWRDADPEPPWQWRHK